MMKWILTWAVLSSSLGFGQKKEEVPSVVQSQVSTPKPSDAVKATPSSKAKIADRKTQEQKELEKDLKKKETVSQTSNVQSYEAEFKKNEASIQLTRDKIKESREVQFLPDLYFMLAELLVDKARIMTDLKKEKAPGTPPEELDFSAEKRVRLEAIETYKSIETRFGRYPNLDRVVFTLAQEYRAVDDMNTALQTYKRFVDIYPDSKLFPKALLEIGNIFFDKKDYEFAIEQYKKVLKLPLNSATPIAYYKTSWCLNYKGEFLNSILSFQKVITETNKLETVETDLREEAIVASAWPFSELKSEDLQRHPELLRPIEYYRQLSYDKATFRRGLKRLTQRLELKGRLNDVADISLELFRVSDDLDDKIEALEKYYLTKKKLKSNIYPHWISKEIAETLWRLKEAKERRSLTSKKDFRQYEALLRDVATNLHLMAQRSLRSEDLLEVVEAYRDYLWIYPESKHTLEIEINIAEANYRAGQLIEAGLNYLKLSERKFKSPNPRLKDWLKSSVQAFLEGFKNPDQLSTLEQLQGREGFRAVAKTYVKLFPTDGLVSTLEFNMAKSLYDEQKFIEAAPLFATFIKKYPNSREMNDATILFLDCYYIREDLKELISQGQKLMNDSRLPSTTRTTVKDVIEQAQLKNVQSLAGEFSSRQYAKKFLEFAEKNKGSALGEQALLEAYYSLRAANDPKVLKIGEQFLGQHGSSPRAKEILSSMIQISLITADFNSAANYLVAYGQKYRDDSVSQGYLSQAAMMMEQMGSAKEASEAYIELKQTDAAARVLAKYGLWTDLAPLASRLSGTKGLYYQGLAYYRMGQRSDGLQLLTRALTSTARTPEEKSMAAHAGMIMFEANVGNFIALGRGQSFSPGLLQSKAQSMEELNTVLQKVMEQGQGKWTVGALAWSGAVQQEFSRFLLTMAPPPKMAATPFKTMMQTQSQTYLQTASDFYNKCMQAINENEIFSVYNEMCAKQGSVRIPEKSVVPLLAIQKVNTLVAPKLRSELLASPRSVVLLNQLYLNALRTGQFYYGRAVAYRMQEIDPQAVDPIAYQGVLSLFLQDPDSAFEYFDQARKLQSNHPIALKGIAGIYNHFNLKAKFAEVASQAGARSPASIPLHPWMNF